MDLYEKKNGIFLPLRDFIKPPVGTVMLEIRDAKTGRLKSRDVIHNTFVTVGKNKIAQWLSGQTVLGPTWCALGTSVVAPALGDTNLTTEVYRKQISVPSFANNVATFQTFFNATETTGTYREAGLFGDLASSIPGSGTLFSKLAINRTKTINDTFTLTWSLIVG